MDGHGSPLYRNAWAFQQVSMTNIRQLRLKAAVVSPFFPKGVEASTIVCFGHLFFDKPIWKTNEFLEKCWCMPLLLCPKDHITGQLDSYQTLLAFKDLSVGHFITTCSRNFGGLTHRLLPARGSIYLLIYACKMSHNLHYGSSANMRYSAYTLHLDRIG